MRTIDLSGQWQFAYTKPKLATQDTSLSREHTAGWEFISDPPKTEDIPADFSGSIFVPGYWDDQKAVFGGYEIVTNPEYRPISYPMGENGDASLPYIIGTVWYRTKITLSTEETQGVLILSGVSTEASVWINGKFVACAFGYATPHTFSLDGYLKEGENILLIAVDNAPHGRLGCSTRGWKGFSGGLYRGVSLRLTGSCRFRDAAAYARDCKFFTLDTLIEGDTDGTALLYSIFDGESEVLSGEFLPEEISGTAFFRRDISSEGLQYWSDTTPKNYTLRLILLQDGSVSDQITLPFGLRLFRRKGMQLMLNDRPIFLRGATEHGYYPQTCTPPADLESYLKNLSILKGLGFNFLRFHTSVPNEEYMTAADRLGFLIQIEPPVSFDIVELEQILRTVRCHPSCAVLCAGNEELLDEEKIDFLAQTAEKVHTLAPSLLFNPQEALRGIEYGWNNSDQGTDCISQPFYYNPRRLSALTRFSDLFGQYAWGYLSYDAANGDNAELDRMQSVYQRPLLSHELGIYGSYIDLSLEQRYEGTRIGTEMYRKAREYLQENGILEHWKTYWLHSCYLQASIRKVNLENARKCRRLSGFDYLGAIDHHWHHKGYQCGILNEFYEEKPGSSKEDVLAWNAPTVLLWDNHIHWTFFCGETIQYPFMLSQFGEKAWQEGELCWSLSDKWGTIVAQGKIKTPGVPCGTLFAFESFPIKLPEKTGCYQLSVTLTDQSQAVSNRWKLWCFEKHSFSAEKVTVTDKLTDKHLAALQNGERILLTSTEAFPSQALQFQQMPAGRPLGMVATVIADHPALRNFPHDGWCDWQFSSMLKNGSAIRWGTAKAPENPAAFAPIIDACLGYKSAGRFGVLCEFAVGKGRLLVCGLHLEQETPEQQYLKGQLIDYLSGQLVDNLPRLSVDALSHFLRGKPDIAAVTFDKGYDKAGQRQL